MFQPKYRKAWSNSRIVAILDAVMSVFLFISVNTYKNEIMFKKSLCKANKVHRTTEAQLKSLRIHNPPTDTGHFHSSSHQKWLPHQILSGKPVKDIHIDQQTMEIWPKQRYVVCECVSESVSDTKP